MAGDWPLRRTCKHSSFNCACRKPFGTARSQQISKVLCCITVIILSAPCYHCSPLYGVHIRVGYNNSNYFISLLQNS